MLSETSKKNQLLANTLVIAITELLFMLGGMQIMSWILFAIDSALNLGTDIQGDFVYEMLTLALFLIPIGFCLIYMRITKPESLKVFRKGSLSERFLSLFAGLAIGFITNGALSLLAGLTESVKIKFHCFTPYMVLILPFCFIQCTCEVPAKKCCSGGMFLNIWKAGMTGVQWHLSVAPYLFFIIA